MPGGQAQVTRIEGFKLVLNLKGNMPQNCNDKIHLFVKKCSIMALMESLDLVNYTNLLDTKINYDFVLFWTHFGVRTFFETN